MRHEDDDQKITKKNFFERSCCRLTLQKYEDCSQLNFQAKCYKTFYNLCIRNQA